MKLYSSLGLAVLFITLPSVLHAQWVQQSIALKPGWNAIFLEVHPEPADCDSLFAGLPVESVWDFNPTVDAPQFVQDPTTLIPGSPNWLTWFPPASDQGALSDLFALRDGRPYLIKLRTDAAPVTWRVTGKPSLRTLTWRPGGLNFVGFHVGTTGPTFQTLFAGEPGLSGQPVYTLGTAGEWQQVVNLSVTRPEAGKAYWVRCTSPARRAATFQVETGSKLGLDFKGGNGELTVRLRNTSTAARNLAVRLLPSATPPIGQAPLATGMPLEYWKASYATAQLGWEPFPPSLNFTALPVGSEQLIRLGLRRPTGAAAAPDARYQGVLEITDDLGSRWLVPVAADTTPTVAATPPAGAFQASSVSDISPRAGLWVGEAVIKSVSQPAHPSAPNLPRPASGEFAFRLIVHVDGAGTARLLQRAYVVRKPPVITPDPDNPGGTIVTEPARPVIASDESFITGLVGSASIVGRCISSAAFAFSVPQLMTGGPFGSGSLSRLVTLDYNDPRNPFKHVFHPDHNNLDERFEQTLPEGRESFTVHRNIGLEFTSTDPLGINPPGWGESEVGGNYRETMTGLHRSPIQIAGTFRLQRVVAVASLNDGQGASSDGAVRP